MPDSKDIVTFLTPTGEEISNDPRYHQEKMRQQVEAQMQVQEVEQPAQVPPQPNPDDMTSEEDTDEDNEDNEDDDGLESMSGNELKAVAAEEDVDTKGLTKKSELIAAIREARA